MLTSGPVPDWLFSIAVAITVFAVMFDLGLAIVPGDFRWVVHRPALMAKAMFSVVIAVPAIAWVVCRFIELPRAAEIGIMLMAIAPGPPVALRRSLEAGAHRSFAPALQIGIVMLAIVSMPLFIAVFDEYYAGEAQVDPLQVARQVFLAQLLPLALGMGATRLMPERAARVEPRLHRIAGLLLVLVLALALIDIWQHVARAGWRVTTAIVLVTLLATAVGHLLAGPEPAPRTATAIASAARNAGLALLVAAANKAPPHITATILAYIVISALALTPYAIWRARATKASAQTA